jgi:UDP-glucose 4-epimerase
MAILVVGGAGYIGSHTVRELIESGKDVIVYDNLSCGHEQAVKGVKLIKGDIADKIKLVQTIKEYNIDSVIHFAAFIQVGESMAHPIKYYKNNVCNTINLLETMKENNVKYIVFSSSAAVYGEPEKVPIDEECAKKPTNVYGRTKLIIEDILSDFDKAYNIKYTALRYFNASGSHISGEIGEAHNPESHLIPIILNVILGKSKVLKIFGNDYPTKDGTCIRDYIHVTDLAKAHILSLEALKNGGESKVYNLGNGNGFSVLEVIKVVKQVTGEKVNYEFADRRPGDTASLVASSEKIIKELGWKQKYNSLEKIVETAWSWKKNHPDGYK